MILVISFAMQVTITPLFAGDNGLYFSEPVAKKLYSDITYYKEVIKVEQEKNELLKKDIELLTERDKLYTQKINLLQKDKEILTKERDDYKEEYLRVSDEKTELEANKPSRLNWFLTGVATAAIIALGGAIAIK